MTLPPDGRPDVGPEEDWYRAFAPATVANFGSGFDAFAVALCALVEEGQDRDVFAGEREGLREDEPQRGRARVAQVARVARPAPPAEREGGAVGPADSGKVADLHEEGPGAGARILRGHRDAAAALHLAGQEADEGRAGSARRIPLGDRVSVRRVKRRGVRILAIHGDGGRLPLVAAENCAAVAAAAVLKAARAPFGLELVLDKGLPLSSGLGSSAASAAAGAFAAALALGEIAAGLEELAQGETIVVPRMRVSGPAAGAEQAVGSIPRHGVEGAVFEAYVRERERGSEAARREHGQIQPGARARSERGPDKLGLLAPALAGEHVADGSWHGDNVWASLMGGAHVVISTRPGELVPLESSRALRWVIVHPRFELSTRRARAVLPARVSLGQAVAQAARFGALVAAWRSGNRRTIGQGLADSLAEPYRAALVPGYVEARRVALCAGAYGISFAGAGPSVVAVTREGAERSVGEAIRAAFRKAGLASTLLVCAVDTRGARKAHA